MTGAYRVNGIPAVFVHPENLTAPDWSEALFARISATDCGNYGYADIWGRAPDDIFVVGQNGHILHYPRAQIPSAA